MAASGRWKVVVEGLELDLRIRRLAREERAAAAGLGKAFREHAGTLPEPAPELAAALAAARALDERGRELAGRLAASLAADRRDYRAADSLVARALVVARGVLDRLVVRDAAWSARRAQPRRDAELGALALTDPRTRELLPEPTRTAEAARHELARAWAERETLLAPFDGNALPRPLAFLARELAAFGGFVRAELAKKLFLRLPALAAMAVGWWLARRYTSSSLEGHWSRLTGSGRSALAPETLALLSFWLPIVAAAAVAYASALLTRRVRRRYLGPDESASR
jgi:hypothetical protein